MKLTLNKSWIASFQWDKSPKTLTSKTGYIFLLSSQEDVLFKKIIKKMALNTQVVELQDQKRDLVYFQSFQGPVWIFRSQLKSEKSTGSFAAESLYTMARDTIGSLVSHFKAHSLEQLKIEIAVNDEEAIRGAFVGLEMGAYQFRSEAGLAKSWQLPVYVTTSDLMLDSILTKSTTRTNWLRGCAAEAQAINSARHWVNLPPNEVNPRTFAAIVKKWKWSSKMQVKVWEGKTLQTQKMNLLLAVGQGAKEGPRFVHLKYRPQKSTRQKPIAFVGKGITFDTGGLDIKPSAAMRLMKKDMGGAAAVLALATWVSEVNYPAPCDFYLCLAENSVDSQSFRPSDVIQARSGHWVEIDNTDAEGRLVLADGLDVAVKQTETPECVIDVATLTGAIKVALGADVAGLFSNDDKLAFDLEKAGRKAGDYSWRMPLVDRYFSSLNSGFADFKNSADGFGGAITAGLFLQKFAHDLKWAHLDIYAWSDRGQGALAATGGNGQAVQALIQFLKDRTLKQ